MYFPLGRANPYVEIDFPYGKGSFHGLRHKHKNEKGNEVNDDFNKMFRQEFWKVYPADGFHTLNYTLVRKDRFGSYTRILADFDFKEIDMSKAINMTTAFLSHPCLENLDTLLSCNNGFVGRKSYEPLGRDLGRIVSSNIKL